MYVYGNCFHLLCYQTLATLAFLFIYFPCVLTFFFVIFWHAQLKHTSAYLSVWILWSRCCLLDLYLSSGCTTYPHCLTVKFSFKRWMQVWYFLLDNLPSEMLNFLLQGLRGWLLFVHLHMFCMYFSVYVFINLLRNYGFKFFSTSTF